METIQNFVGDVKSFVLNYKNTSKPYIANGIKADWLICSQLVQVENWGELRAYSENRIVEIESKLAYYPSKKETLNDFVDRLFTHKETIKNAITNLPENFENDFNQSIDESDYNEGTKLDIRNLWTNKISTARAKLARPSRVRPSGPTSSTSIFRKRYTSMMTTALPRTVGPAIND